MIFIVALRVGYHCTTYYENLPNISSPSISCHKVLSVCEFVIVCQHMGCNNHNLSDESCRFWGVHPILKATHLQISLNQLEIHWISHGSFHWVSHGSGLAQGRHRFPHFSGLESWVSIREPNKIRSTRNVQSLESKASGALFLLILKFPDHQPIPFGRLSVLS